MKTYITLAIALTMSCNLVAQKVRVGFVAGANYSNLIFSNSVDADPMNGMKPGVTGGLVTEFDFGRLSLHLTFLFSEKGTMDKYTIDGMKVKDKINLSYFEIPINLIYNFPSGGKGHFFAGGGPYVAWLASAVNKMKAGNFKETHWFNTGTSQTDDLLEVDYGLNALVGYRPGLNFSISIHYTRGLINLLPEREGSDTKLFNQNFSLRIGYFFKGHQD